MASKQSKIDALRAAIEAVKALGEDYDKMVDTLEKDLYAAQSEVEHEEKAKKQAEDKAWIAAYWSRYEAEQQRKQELTAKIPQLRKAVQDAKKRIKAIADYSEWSKLDYQLRTAVAELEDAEKQLRWL